MEVQRGKAYAVITGDIVSSSRLPEDDRRELHRVMNEGAAALREVFPEAVPADMDIFRGDSWQVLVTDPVFSLRVGLFYRAFLRARMQDNKVDTRMVIAVGTVDFVPDDHVSAGDGEAYRESGRTLERMPKSGRMQFVLAGKPREDSQAVDVVVQLLDVLAMHWTERQAQAVAGALRGWKQEKIAGSWKEKSISQQAVAQHLDRAGWHAVESGIEYFEQYLRRLCGTSH